MATLGFDRSVETSCHKLLGILSSIGLLCGLTDHRQTAERAWMQTGTDRQDSMKRELSGIWRIEDRIFSSSFQHFLVLKIIYFLGGDFLIILEFSDFL